MARNGAGTYSKVNTFVASNTITAAGHNQNWDDLVAEITNSVAADGQTTITGALKGSDGTVSLPGYSFSADLDSGLYRIGANNLGVAVNGAKVLDVNTTGLGVVGTLLNGNGTVSLPAFSFTADTDSGVYRIGANNIGIGVAGANVLDIGTAGLSITGTLTISTALTVTAGGLTVTAGGLTVTAGGLTVTAGTLSFPAGGVANAALAVPNAFVLIQTQAASNSATIDFSTGLDDTSYDEFMLVLTSLKPQTDDQDLWLRIGTGGGPSYISTGTYGWSSTAVYANSATANPRSTNLTDTKMVLTGNNGGQNVGNATGENYSGVVYFSNPEASDFVNFMWDGRYSTATPDTAAVRGGGRYNVAGAITGVRVMFASGNIVSGRLSLYGLKKA